MHHARAFSLEPDSPGGGGTGGGASIGTTIAATNTVIAAASGWVFYPIANGTNAAFVVKLPPTPSANQFVSIADILGNAGTYNITINGNGNNIMAYGTSAATFLLNANGATVNPLAWIASSSLWALFGVA